MINKLLIFILLLSFSVITQAAPVWYSNGTYTAGAQSAGITVDKNSVTLNVQPAGDNCDQLGGSGGLACRTGNLDALRVYYATKGTQTCGTDDVVDTSTAHYHDSSIRVLDFAGTYDIQQATLLDVVPSSGIVELEFKQHSTFDSTRGTTNRIFGKTNLSGDFFDVYLSSTDGKLYARKYSGGTAVTYSSAQTSWTGGTWYLLEYIWGQKGFSVKIDGVEIMSDPDGLAPADGSDREFVLGAWMTGTPSIVHNFEGEIRNFAVWDTTSDNKILLSRIKPGYTSGTTLTDEADNSWTLSNSAINSLSDETTVTALVDELDTTLCLEAHLVDDAGDLDSNTVEVEATLTTFNPPSWSDSNLFPAAGIQSAVSTSTTNIDVTINPVLATCGPDSDAVCVTAGDDEVTDLRTYYAPRVGATCNGDVNPHIHSYVSSRHQYLYPNALYYGTQATLLDTPPSDGVTTVDFDVDSTTPVGYLIGKRSDNDNQIEIKTVATTYDLQFVKENAGTTTTRTISSITWAINTVYRLVAEWGGGGQNLYLFDLTNGTLVGSSLDATETGAWATGTQSDFRLGARAITPSGTVHDGRIYKAVINDGTSDIASYHFYSDDAATTTATDGQGTYDLTLSNALIWGNDAGTSVSLSSINSSTPHCIEAHVVDSAGLWNDAHVETEYLPRVKDYQYIVDSSSSVTTKWDGSNLSVDHYITYFSDANKDCGSASYTASTDPATSPQTYSSLNDKQLVCASVLPCLNAGCTEKGAESGLFTSPKTLGLDVVAYDYLNEFPVGYDGSATGGNNGVTFREVIKTGFYDAHNLGGTTQNVKVKFIGAPSGSENTKIASAYICKGINASETAECDGPNRQLFFSGSAAGTIAAASTLTSDAVQMEIDRDATYFVSRYFDDAAQDQNPSMTANAGGATAANARMYTNNTGDFASAASFTPTYNHTHYFGFGELIIEEATTPESKMNSDDVAITYSAGWSTSTNANYYKGDAESVSASGEYAEWTDTGCAFYGMFTTDTGKGSIDVKVDAGTLLTIDTSNEYSDQVPYYGVPLLLYSDPECGAHTIRVTTTSTSNVILEGVTTLTTAVIPNAAVKTLAAYGDSLVVGGTLPAMGERQSSRFSTLLANDYGLTEVNHGLGGREQDHMLSQMSKYLLGDKPNKLLLISSINGFACENYTDEPWFKHRWRSVLTYATTLFPNTEVMVGNIAHVKAAYFTGAACKKGSDSLVHRNNAVLADVVAEYPSVKLADIHREMQHIDGLIWTDKVHPNAEGNKVISEAYKKAQNPAEYYQ